MVRINHFGVTGCTGRVKKNPDHVPTAFRGLGCSTFPRVFLLTVQAEVSEDCLKLGCVEGCEGPKSATKTQSSYPTVPCLIPIAPAHSKSYQPNAKRRRVGKEKTEICLFYSKFGKTTSGDPNDLGECKNGSQCPFKHDPKKVAVCTKFLRGECTNPQCRLQHSSHLKNNSVCYHFLQGICTNPNCPYTHVKVNAQASICPDYLKGYCPRGQTCKLQHVKKPRNQTTDKRQPTGKVTKPQQEVVDEEVRSPRVPDGSDSVIRPSFGDDDELDDSNK